MNPLLEQIRPVNVIDATTSKNTDITGTASDISGFGAIAYIAQCSTGGSGMKMHVETGATTSAFADVIGSEVSSTGGNTLWCDVHRPLKQYTRPIVTRTTGALGHCTALLYNPRTGPVANTTASTIQGEIHIAPTTGTK